jgi:RNA polymerase sigma-54 factor
MQLELRQDPLLVPTTTVSFRMIAANYVLAMSSLELQQTVQNELNENPALDQLEVSTCPVCGIDLQGSLCPRCPPRTTGQDLVSHTGDELYDTLSPPAQATGESEIDPMLLVASEATLAERLLAELGLLIDTPDLLIAEFLVGSLDDSGYLSSTPAEVADLLQVDIARVRAVLLVLQGLEPVGIGARNLRECLLIQIDHLARAGMEQPHVRAIVDEYLQELGAYKLNLISDALGIPKRAVEDAWDFIKGKLHSHPAQGVGAMNAHDRDARAMYVLPDVIIGQKGEGFEVEIVQSKRLALRLSPLYLQLAQAKARGASALSPADDTHVAQYVSRAKVFISNINQRRRTLSTITCCLVEHQQAFLRHGVRYLKPLSRVQIADQLGLHESTVSRAMASKYVMVPTGEVIPFSHFFTPALSVKAVMKEIIERERRPLTDSEIGERLQERGISIARRTVAKYRMQLRILPSMLR